mgnify:CR=1 FL=1
MQIFPFLSPVYKRFFLIILDFPHHQCTNLHLQDGSCIGCPDQAELSGIFLIDRLQIVCNRVNCMEDSRDLIIAGFFSGSV